MSKATKAMAADADYEHVLSCLADVEMSIFEEADELEVIEPETSTVVAAEVEIVVGTSPAPHKQDRHSRT